MDIYHVVQEFELKEDVHGYNQGNIGYTWTNRNLPFYVYQYQKYCTKNTYQKKFYMKEQHLMNIEVNRYARFIQDSQEMRDKLFLLSLRFNQ